MIDKLPIRLQGAVQFLRMLGARFEAHQGPQNAASLTFTTLLSLVPLTTVVLSLLTALPVWERAGDLIQDFLFENFVPAAGDAIRAYLHEFSSNASRMTGIGFLLLLLVALMLMSSVDKALNTIWEVRKKRRLLGKFMVYWVILSLGPLAIVASILGTSYLLALPFLSEAVHTGIGQFLLSLTPIGFSIVGFTILYLMVPNRVISLKHALLGGTLAALLFEVAKHGFAAYLTHFPTYQAIYGTLATIPIFLIWLYLSWLIVLLGAEFAHCLEIFRRYRGSGKGESNKLVEMIELLVRIAGRQSSGDRTDIRMLSRDYVNVESLLTELADKGFLYVTDEAEWVLGKCLSDIKIYDLYLAFQKRLPVEGEDGWPIQKQLADSFAQANLDLGQNLDIPLNEVKFL